ncbi:MAG: Unknown protein [uncultured Sulfurovum sp.]|uniref:Uncharacterized protein n=1 Tax=uncultured Sulfurovum sp. TaxID=269237 RepID=A0A6S6TY89_9BACT|nr:MAG: Unknown protein [uncultured Sulfurovum sp.]
MPTIEIKLKKLGKKKIKSFSVTLTASVETLKDLITQMVSHEVERFNEKQDNPTITPFLTPVALDTKSKEGKVSFGDLLNQEKAVIEEAIENALLGFKDGLFLVFIDDREIKEIDETIILTAKSEVVFMRLTFLTGTYW